MDEIRAPDNKRDLAYEDYLKGYKYKDIAEKYEVSLNTVKSWKTRYKWSRDGVHTKEKVCTQPKKRKVGGQPGNKNATGPPGNKNAEKHGLFSKYLPKETLELMEGIKTRGPIDLLWDQITIQYAAIIRAQHIMYVKDQEDMTKELKREKRSDGENSSSWEEEYNIQFAWDKQASFLQAQSRAMTALNSMIKQYDDLIHKEWDKVSEEQKLRIEKLKVDISNAKDDDLEEVEDDGFIDALEGKVDDIWQE